MARFPVRLVAASVLGIALLAAQTSQAIASGASTAAATTASQNLASTPHGGRQLGQTSQIGSAIVPGFNSVTFGPNDDGSYPCTSQDAGVPPDCTPTPIPLPFPVNFYGTEYSSIYLNNNGNLTFGQPLGDYTPESLNQINIPMIAPFWADVDTRTGPVVTFGYGTVDGHLAFGVNWIGVGCYAETNSVADTFQVLLIDRPDLGAGDWSIEFNYGPITWDSGQASGGDGQCLGGTAARAGYTSGAGPSCELPGSGVNGGLLSSNPETGLSGHDLNSSVQGQYIFEVGAYGQPNGCSGYVALGDSYSSGQGTIDSSDPSTYWTQAPCWQGPLAWPVQLSEQFPAAPAVSRASFFACSGDTTGQLISNQIPELQNWVSQHGSPSLVTVTVGGDNLQFAPLLAACYTDSLDYLNPFSSFQTPSQGCAEFMDNELRYLDSGQFTQVLSSTYQKIAAAAGGSDNVVVVGYPNLFPPTGAYNEASADSHCPWMLGDSGAFLSLFDNGQARLNAVMSQAASEAGVRYVQLGDLFAGHELCTGDSYINALWDEHNAGHPTAEGQSVIANYVGTELGYLSGNGSNSSSQAPEAPAAGGAKKPLKPSGKTSSSAHAGIPASARVELSGATYASGTRAMAGPASISPITAGLTDGTVSVPYAGFLSATGGTPPYTWSVTGGSLPAGLSLDADTGIISGTPTTAGTSDFTVTATDSSSPAQIVTATESINVSALATLAVTTSSLPNPTAGQQYAATLSAYGGTYPYTWAVTSGSLPSGLSLNTDSGVITGTPVSSGTSTFTVTVTDSSDTAETATASFTLNVAAASEPLSLTTPQLPAGVQGIGYTGTLTSTGGNGPLYWSVSSGSLPDGLSLDAGTGQITGTPTASGTFTFTVEVNDSSSPAPESAVQSESITIAAASAPAIDPATVPDATQGQAYYDVITASGGVAPYNWSVSSGSLPDGLSLDPTTGEITGTPTTPGSYSFSIGLTDSSTPNPQAATISLAMTVDAAPPPPALTVSDTVTDGTVGVPYDASVIPADGTSPYTFTVSSGALPDGLTLDPNFGTITGTPTTTGTYSATIQVTDSSTPSPQVATDSVTITIAAPGPLSVTTSSLPDAVIGAAYAEPVAATGGTAPYSFSVSGGSLPAGLTLDPSSGIIYGTPTATGESSFTVTVTDSASTPDTASVDLTLNTDPAPPVAINATSLPDAAQNVSYSQILSASGGVPPYSWAVTSGSLPDGLVLDPVAGVISGTPTESGSYTFTVQVTDSSSPAAQTATQTFTLSVDAAAPLTIDTTGLDAATQGTYYSETLGAEGGTSPLTWSISSGALPGGLTLDPNAGTISGTPTGSGTSYFTVEVTDSSTPTPEAATQQLSLEVIPQAPTQIAQSISFSAPPPGVVGESAALSATGGGSGNPVVFSVDATSGNGVCAISGTTVSYTGVGSCVIDANQAGNATYSAAPEVQQTVSVGQATTSTALSVSGANAVYGHEQTTVFRVTVSPQYTGSPTGTVTVRAGATTLCTGTLSGGATACSASSATALAPGSHSVTAAYSGSTDFGPSGSVASTVKIAKASTRSTLSLSTSSATYGREKTLVVTVKVSPQYAGTPGGTITVKAGKVTLCSKALSRGKATCSPRSGTVLRVGKYQLVATYSGNADFNGSKSAARTLKVVKPAKKKAASIGPMSAALRIGGLIARSFELYIQDL